MDSCEHVPQGPTAPRALQCEECGSRTSIRLCATCGHVGCCESQAGHGRAHAMAERHPVILSLPLSERSFTWCYAHKDYVQRPADLSATTAAE